MRKLLLMFLFFMISIFIYSQQNKFFIELSQKELATFNDGITLMKLLYNERNDNSAYVDNILWAAGKKLFKVTIPIKTDQINPVLTRREFAYWIVKIFNGPKGLVNRKKIRRHAAYRICVEVGILDKGRGAFDSFTGAELVDTFSFLDYYVRFNDIRPKKGELEILDDTYKNLPQWREKLHRELDEQQEMEQQIKQKKRESRKLKRQEMLKKIKVKQIYIEKDAEKKIEE